MTENGELEPFAQIVLDSKLADVLIDLLEGRPDSFNDLRKEKQQLFYDAEFVVLSSETVDGSWTVIPRLTELGNIYATLLKAGRAFAEEFNKNPQVRHWRIDIGY